MTERSPSPVAFTVPEVAIQLRCSRATAYELIRSGELRSVRLGRKLIRVTPQALEDFLNGHSAGVSA